jgi:ADP-ribosylglycohydrolase
MPKNPSVRVTADLLKALTDLKASLKELPAGEAKKTAQAALRVLNQALAGKTKPLAKVTSCPRELPFY